MRERAAAISSGVGFVEGDSCQRRFNRGVIDVFWSSWVADDAIVGV
jgi:hypothetical protein